MSAFAEVFHQATLERLGYVNSEYPGLYGATLHAGSKQKAFAEPTTKAWARILSAAALAGLLAVAALLCLFSFSSLVAEQQEGGRAEAFLKAHSTSRELSRSHPLLACECFCMATSVSFSPPNSFVVVGALFHVGPSRLFDCHFDNRS
jgi:hypothetical protein